MALDLGRGGEPVRFDQPREPRITLTPLALPRFSIERRAHPESPIMWIARATYRERMPSRWLPAAADTWNPKLRIPSPNANPWGPFAFAREDAYVDV